jgi:hypothetical protein
MTRSANEELFWNQKLITNDMIWFMGTINATIDLVF